MFKMVKLLRNNQAISRIMDIISIHPSALRLVKLVLLYFLYPVHMMACIWYYTASYNSKPDCWAAGVGLFEQDAMTKYMVSFYWSM